MLTRHANTTPTEHSVWVELFLLPPTHVCVCCGGVRKGPNTYTERYRCVRGGQRLNSSSWTDSILCLTTGKDGPVGGLPREQWCWTHHYHSRQLLAVAPATANPRKERSTVHMCIGYNNVLTQAWGSKGVWQFRGGPALVMEGSAYTFHPPFTPLFPDLKLLLHSLLTCFLLVRQPSSQFSNIHATTIHYRPFQNRDHLTNIHNALW